jgi:hypothetical protein
MLWNRGVLTWKLDATQKQLYDCYAKAKYKTVVWSCSRRLGKSYTLCVLAIEACIKKPNCVVKYVAPQQKMVKTIIRPLLREILSDCPPELMPEFKTIDNVYRFPNGSEIQLAGNDAGHAESLRGGASDLCVVDEAGFCDDLSNLVGSILLPTTTTTKGKVVLASTPPKNQDHDFNAYIEKAELHSTYIKKTIYDNPRLSAHDIQDIIDEYGGENSIEFRREFMCENITDENTAVVAEFTEQVEKDTVKEWPRPPFYDYYVSMDLGFQDLTVVLFGYYDFRHAKIIIEDELVLNGIKLTTDFLAKEIKRKEEELLPVNKQSGEQKRPYMRVSDNDLIVINDLHRLHGLTFLATEKDNSEAALNHMKIMIHGRNIIIHPRCKTLIRHLKRATWNKTRKSYARSAENGHYDAIDALKYLVRNIVYSKNPYPANYGIGFGDQWFRGHLPDKKKPNTTPESHAASSLKNLFKIKPTFNK